MSKADNRRRAQSIGFGRLGQPTLHQRGEAMRMQVRRCRRRRRRCRRRRRRRRRRKITSFGNVLAGAEARTLARRTLALHRRGRSRSRWLQRRVQRLTRIVVVVVVGIGRGRRWRRRRHGDQRRDGAQIGHRVRPGVRLLLLLLLALVAVLAHPLGHRHEVAGALAFGHQQLRVDELLVLGAAQFAHVVIAWPMELMAVVLSGADAATRCPVGHDRQRSNGLAQLRAQSRRSAHGSHRRGQR